MNASIRSILAAAVVACLPMAAAAQHIVLDYTIGAGDTSIGGDPLGLTPGVTWEASYTLAPGAGPFILDLEFFAISSSPQALTDARFGFRSANQQFTDLQNNGSEYAAIAMQNGVRVSGAFSIFYTLPSNSTDSAEAFYFGSLRPAEAVEVPEIGAEGAMVALLLAFGGIAVMTGARRREQDIPLGA